MEKFLEEIVRRLVDHPDRVCVTVDDGETSTVLRLSVAREDMGRVIGRDGKVARALRTVVKAAFRNNPKPVYVDIEEQAEDAGQTEE